MSPKDFFYSRVGNQVASPPSPNMNPFAITSPSSGVTDFLDKLQAYNCNTGVDTLLDLSRLIQESGNYYYQGLAFPDLEVQASVPANSTISGTMVVPPGTFVTGISAVSLPTGSPFSEGAGFNLKIYDKGSKASIFYGDYAQSGTVAGNFFGPVQDTPVGSALLQSPFIITGPGVIGWDIVNLATTARIMQVLLDCAVPISNRSILHVVVKKGV